MDVVRTVLGAKHAEVLVSYGDERQPFGGSKQDALQIAHPALLLSRQRGNIVFLTHGVHQPAAQPRMRMLTAT